jgi:ATP-dependent Clp protease ATP-binding subunit ClpC
MAKNTIPLDETQGLDRLTEKAKRIIVRAFEIAKEYQSPTSEPIHIFLAMLQDDTAMPANILTKLGLDIDSTTKSIQENLRKEIALNNTNFELSPTFSENLKNLINQSYMVAQRLSNVYVGTEHLLLAIMQMREQDFVRELENAGITAERVERNLATNPNLGNPLTRDNMKGEPKEPTSSALDYFAVNMNELARNGKYLPIFGRENEVRRLIHILARKTKNNPILVGDAGVGKTAIVEGFVQRIVSQDVPASFINKTVLNLDISGIIAGSRVRGDVEERVLAIVNDAIDAGDKILFIDEIHMIVGAGGSGGGGGIDIANILKPYLTNSDLRVIGATTIDEYRKYFETDAALTRRFQPIQIDEIDPKSAISVLHHLKPSFEKYHKVKITDDAIEDAVKLSKRYIADRFLPDKAIDLIDEAAAQVKIGQEIEIEPELSKLGNKLMEVQRRKDEAMARSDIALAAKYKDQENIVTSRIVSVVEGDSHKGNRKKVTSEMIKQIVSTWTKIPVSQEAINDNIDLNNLQEQLKLEVMGQDHAIETVVSAVKRSHMGLSDESKPLSSFLFLGPTGIGKSQLAKSLANVLFGSEDMLIQIDMSEYMESHSVSKMIGSPPGYVGYQEGGQLTERIRTQPYSVILFDEIEKAHPDILNILLQILNDGHLQDGKGKRVSFKNTLIILTSNIGAEEVSQDSRLGFDVDIDKEEKDKVEEAFEEMSDRIITALKDYLRPELLNRIDETIVFRGLNKQDCLGITQRMVEQLRYRLVDIGIDLKLEKSIVEFINEEGYSKEYGGRNLKRKVQSILENSLADFLLEHKYKQPKRRRDLTQISAKLNKKAKKITFSVVK